MHAKRRFTNLARQRPWAAAALSAVSAALVIVIMAAPCPAADTGRKDNVFGTTREGMDMGRDPATGDIIMRVSPADPGPDQQQPLNIQPEIRPEITLPPPEPKTRP